MVMRLIKDAKRYPILSPERERALATAWHDRHDRAAVHELIGSHLRFVVKIAHGFAGYGLPLADLVAEGNVGLMQAAEKFEPSRGFRFASYAIWWIRAAIQEYVIHSWSLVKIGTTGAQKKLFFNLRRVKARLADFEQGDLRPEAVTAIAEDLQVPETAVVEMNRRLGGADNSLNAKRADDAEGEWIEFLVDDRPNQEMLVGDTEESRRRHTLLTTALDKLKPRERDIVVRRHLRDVPVSLQELSHRHAISCERVRQIELHAIAKMTAVVARARNEKRPFANVDTRLFPDNDTAPSGPRRRRDVMRAPALLGAA
jgi:RNA polymerase sigma-32 factor